MADKEVTLIAAGSTFTVVGKTPYLTATLFFHDIFKNSLFARGHGTVCRSCTITKTFLCTVESAADSSVPHKPGSAE